MTWKVLRSLALTLLVAVACGSDDASNSDSQSSATPSASPSLAPPRPVTATGEFICVAETTPAGCPPGLTSGSNTMELKFDLSGGPFSGTAVGQAAESAPGCSWDTRTEVAPAGQFNPFGKTFTGTARVTFIKTLTGGAPEQCNPQISQPVETTNRSDLFPQALLQVDDITIMGCLLVAAAACYAEFLLSIPLESLNQP